MPTQADYSQWVQESQANGTPITPDAWSQHANAVFGSSRITDAPAVGRPPVSGYPGAVAGSSFIPGLISAEQQAAQQQYLRDRLNQVEIPDVNSQIGYREGQLQLGREQASGYTTQPIGNAYKAMIDWVAAFKQQNGRSPTGQEWQSAFVELVPGGTPEAAKDVYDKGTAYIAQTGSILNEQQFNQLAGQSVSRTNPTVERSRLNFDVNNRLATLLSNPRDYISGLYYGAQQGLITPQQAAAALGQINNSPVFNAINRQSTGNAFTQAQQPASSADSGSDRSFNLAQAPADANRIDYRAFQTADPSSQQLYLGAQSAAGRDTVDYLQRLQRGLPQAGTASFTTGFRSRL